MSQVKLAKVGAIKPMAEVYGGVIPHSNDALNIRIDYSRNGKYERIDNVGSINMPPGVQHAIKQCYQYNNDNVVVMLLEMYPIYGRQWINLYTPNSSWKGWKSTTPQ